MRPKTSACFPSSSSTAPWRRPPQRSARNRKCRGCASASATSSPKAACRPIIPVTSPGLSPATTKPPQRASKQALADFSPLPERFTGQFHRLHTALTTGGELPVTLADARRSIELLTAIYYSSLTGEPVALPLKPDHPFYNGWIAAMKNEAAHG